MPLYEWDCPLCLKPSESLSKPYDPVVCPHCGCTELTRKFPLPAPHKWKGSIDGAMPSKRAAASAEMDRKLGKRERVTGMLDKQAAKIDGK